MKLILEKRVVPVVVIDKVENAQPLAEALMAGGLNLLEITLRTAAAEESIRRIAKTFSSQVLIGAGTLLTPDQVARAVDAGAQFGVSPGFNARVVQKAKDLKLPFYPGVMTPSDVEAALDMGCQMLKFFPAEPAGGVKMLKALAGPYAHTGVKFIPLGGINQTNARDYLQLPIVGAIGGSWIAESKAIAEQKWADITRLAQEILGIVAQTPKK